MTVANPAVMYESFMVPTLFAPWAERLVEAAAPRPGERALDVGTGTGIVARRVAPLVGAGGSVTGLDVSPDMLEVARERARAEGADIRWEQGMAEQLPFGDGSFDLTVSQFALMFFSDRQAALREMRRVLAPDGRVALSVWQGLDRHPFYEALHASIQTRLGMSAVGEIFALGDEGELRRMLANAGFGRASVEPISMTARFPNPDGFLAGEIAVDTAAIPSMQQLDPAQRQEIVAAIRDDMRAPLRRVTEGDYVTLPFHALIVRAAR